MLHKDPFIIAPETFSLVQKLKALPELDNFFLVGGTALALQLGHRNSIDIDLFTQNDFSAEEISKALSRNFIFKTTLSRNNTVLSVINNIKTDFIKHDYPLLNPPVTEEGITFLSKEDIAAMKFHAIIQSGKRLKDFIDIYFLLEHFSMSQMLAFFEKKYVYTSGMIAMKAINYFGDIDENIDPPKLIYPLALTTIKERIELASLHPNKTF
jgi:Nucleotidyl transferase AbiEii toxin, Type IV TA system